MWLASLGSARSSPVMTRARRKAIKHHRGQTLRVRLQSICLITLSSSCTLRCKKNSSIVSIPQPRSTPIRSLVASVSTLHIGITGRVSTPGIPPDAGVASQPCCGACKEVCNQSLFSIIFVVKRTRKTPLLLDVLGTMGLLTLNHEQGRKIEDGTCGCAIPG